MTDEPSPVESVRASSDRRAPIVLLGLDAVEIELLDHFVEIGCMPNLAALRARGFSGRLRTNPQQFLSIVWTTMFSGNSLDVHGWYFNKQWNFKNQQVQAPDRDWLPLDPFWLDLDDDCMVTLFDVPFAVGFTHHPNQTHVTGWQCHDDFGKSVHPRSLKTYLANKFGKSPMTAEVFGPQSVRSLQSMLQEVKDTTAQFGDVTADLIANFDQDVLFTVLGSIHRGTHYLWDTTQIDIQDASPEDLEVLTNALQACYSAMDDALGKIIAATPPTTRLFSFALHGMGPNLGWYEYLPRIVERIHDGPGAAKESKHGLVYRLKKAIPWQVSRQITRRIPARWNKALLPLWSRSMYDWSRTRYFTIPMDYNGYVRLNLAGREKQGILMPADVDAEIERLEAGLKSFKDINTGKPVVKGLTRIEQVIGESAVARDHLPDLIVTWAADFPTSQSCGVVSDIYGEVRWPEGRKLSSGRSGNHTPHGWFVASGPGIVPGTAQREVDSTDIVPTVLRWLGKQQSDKLKGRPIDEIIAD